MADECDNVAGKGLVDGFALVRKQFVRTRKPNPFSTSGVGDAHVAFKFSGTHADEGNAITMFRVHVGLNLEHESGEGRMLPRDFTGRGVPGSRGGRMLKEA